ncbi:MAG: arginase family protein [Nanoarchaeota archaeon]|nr:arginase family protein [Nanoarchaeota archaeon]
MIKKLAVEKWKDLKSRRFILLFLMHRYGLLVIPDWLGSANKNGVELGPSFIENSILSSELKKRFSCFSNINVPEPDKKHLNGEYKNIKYLPEIKEMCLEAKKETEKIIEAGDVPVVLNGDDSALIGVLTGIASKFGNDYALIYIDAHGDINTPESSPSGKIFGMVLAHLMGLGNKELIKLNGKFPSLKKENLILIGQRDLDPGEVVFIKENNINTFSAEEVNEKSSKEVVENIFSRLNGINEVFVHIDLDVLDPEECSGFSMPVPNGIKIKKLIRLVKEIIKKSPKNIGLSVGEYNPKKDKKNKTRNVTLKIIKDYINN